ncbi:MAG: hypothetical protein IPJ77_25010 [Planctomycetes bacterium]|nr:hypothetical protein [Planctomycetota bacterium]
MLATIAQKLGLRVWIARNDRNRIWNGTTLGTFSPQDAPSFGIDRPTQRAIELIDVLWIKGKSQVVAAFEVESTTSIYSGLLRMSDLAATAPNISFPLYIVVPEARMEDVEKTSPSADVPAARTAQPLRVLLDRRPACADAQHHAIRWRPEAIEACSARMRCRRR